MNSRVRASFLRIAFGVTMAVVLVVCLIGILVTGPVVVTTAPLELELEISSARMRDTVHRLTR